MADTFTYSIASDTANGLVDNDKLFNEIAESTSISIQIVAVNSEADVLTIVFITDLSISEETALDALVAAHDGIRVISPSIVQIADSDTGADVTDNAVKVTGTVVEQRNIDQKYVWRDARFSNGSTTNLDLNGSSTPQDFTFGPPSGEVWYVRFVSILILDPGSPDVDDFGSIGGGLTNGMQFVQQIDNVEYELGNFKDNGALSLCFTDSAYSTPASEDGVGWLDEDDCFLGQKIFDPPIRLDGDADGGGDKMIFRIRDNLNAIQRLQAVGRAYRLLP